MNRENIESIIKSMEILLNSLKMELNTIEESPKEFQSVHPLEYDDDIEYYEED